MKTTTCKSRADYLAVWCANCKNGNEENCLRKNFSFVGKDNSNLNRSADPKGRTDTPSELFTKIVVVLVLLLFVAAYVVKPLLVHLFK
jgi:hypothetical protein